MPALMQKEAHLAAKLRDLQQREQVSVHRTVVVILPHRTAAVLPQRVNRQELESSLRHESPNCKQKWPI